MQAVEQQYWDQAYSGMALHFDPEQLLFKELFARYLPQGGDCLEIGCYPGGYLAYLCRQFGYQAHGVDLTPHVTQLPAFLRQLGVSVGSIEQADFRSYAPGQTYDVVCSFGFIEHFYDFPAIIQQHIQLVKPGGYLVLSCPNFRRGQWALHRLLDAENLQRHVLPAMDLSVWRDLLLAGQMQLLHHDYYQTADFWTASCLPHRWQRGLARRVQNVLQALNRRVNWPNRWLSPHLISISRKVGA